MRIHARAPALLAVGFAALAGCDAAPLAPPADPAHPRPARGASLRLVRDRLTVVDGPVPVRMGELVGSAMIRLAGEVGGTVGGTMSISVGGNRTRHVVRDGRLAREGDGTRWVLEGQAVVPGRGATIRPSRAELLLRSGAALRDGDIWIIDGVTYIRDRGEWLCL